VFSLLVAEYISVERVWSGAGVEINRPPVMLSESANPHEISRRVKMESMCNHRTTGS